MKSKKVTNLLVGSLVVLMFVLAFSDYSAYAVYLILIFPPATFYALFNNVVKGRQSLRWRQVKGTVLRSEVKTSSGSGTSFIPIMEYEYKVLNKSYVNNTISYKPKMRTASGFSRVLQKYPVGHEVDVYYNPGNPKQSVLERGASKASNLAMFGFFLFSCILVYLFWSKGTFPV